VLVDNETGGAMAMRHLIELGHRKIAVIRGPEEMFDSAPRWAGIRAAADAAGIEIDMRMVAELPSMVDPASGFEGGVRFARELVEARRRFTAVLAFDDLTALGVVRGLSEHGLRVPEDCSVVGFDDVLPAAVSTPAITTIRQPLGEMGLAAARLLVEALTANEKGARKPPAQIVLGEPQLVTRQSAAPPKRPAVGKRAR
jgi:LacI family transcriptional regulator